MKKIKFIFFSLPWVLLLILITILIYRKDLIQSYIGDPSKPLYDSIARLHDEVKVVHAKLDLKNKEYDSLLTIDKEIKYIHDEKIKFIYSTATTSDLDSFIRTGIKTKR